MRQAGMVAYGEVAHRHRRMDEDQTSETRFRRTAPAFAAH